MGLLRAPTIMLICVVLGGADGFEFDRNAIDDSVHAEGNMFSRPTRTSPSFIFVS